MKIANREKVVKLLERIDKKDEMIKKAKELTFDSIGVTIKSYPKTTEKARKVIVDRLELEKSRLVEELETL